MKLIYFVSITICVALSIDDARSQQQNFNAFPQPKAIRDNSGYFRQEIFYPGHGGNLIGQQHSGIVQPAVVQNQIQASPIPVPVSIPFTSIPAGPPITLHAQQPIVDPSVVRSVQNRLKPVALPPVLAAATTTTTYRPTTTTEPATSEELEEQNQSAYYKFGTSVRDTINDHEHVRQEIREGLALKGMYSYSDGFFRRTVFYEADEGGYRVTKEEIQPIGDGEGPKFNPKGSADVRSTLTGDYSITVDDFRLNKRQEDAIKNQD